MITVVLSPLLKNQLRYYIVRYFGFLHMASTITASIKNTIKITTKTIAVVAVVSRAKSNDTSFSYSRKKIRTRGCLCKTDH